MIDDLETNKSAKNYENRIVAFIDILGFRNRINETYKDDVVNQEKLFELLDALSLIRTEFENELNNMDLPRSFIITYFSDSIVFSILQTNNLSLLNIFEIVKRIQIKLIRYEILLRGGVVAGKLLHDANFVMGPAMNDAYDLESKSAVYPRITIDPDVMEMSAQEDDSQGGLIQVKAFDFHKTFEIDFDNTYYIDYFSDAGMYLEDGNEKLYYQRLRKIIRNGVNRKDIGIRMKYMWMMKKFNLGKPSYVRDMSYKEVDELNLELGRLTDNTFSEHST